MSVFSTSYLFRSIFGPLSGMKQHGKVLCKGKRASDRNELGQNVLCFFTIHQLPIGGTPPYTENPAHVPTQEGITADSVGGV